jgi:hypothetical protein
VSLSDGLSKLGLGEDLVNEVG